MKRFVFSVYCLMLHVILTLGQTNGYFIQFTDKNHSLYSADHPEGFLSQRAIDRRQKQNIAITEEDLPVSVFYTDSLKQLNIEVRYTTKWLNGAVVFSSDTELMDTLDKVSFIRYVEMTKLGNKPGAFKKFEEGQISVKSSNDNEYGQAWDQIRTINGHLLHQKGYTGKGMQIAVVDAGFNSAESLPSFQHLWNNGQILGAKDFVNPTSNIFEENAHGMKVLSIMGGEISGTYKGTAPEAGYWLIRTEDAYSETPIEPDYWVCAAEFADSAGVDVINSSLGYYQFDYPFDSDKYESNIDGNSRASKAAEIAASKGMVVVVSAGNEGNDSWHYIGVPADARNILSVAAMAADSTKASFSSFGPSYDGRVKPEVAAMGSATAVQSLGGGIEKGNGTSYSAPVIAGMVACLWQALPDYRAQDIVDLVLRSSNHYSQPDNSFGYGIPDFNVAIKTNVAEFDNKPGWLLSPNPFDDYIVLKAASKYSENGSVKMLIYDMIGNKVVSREYVAADEIIVDGLAALPKGLYILLLEAESGKYHFKLLKK